MLTSRELTNNLVLPLWQDRVLEVIDDFIAPNADIRTTFLSGVGPTALKQSASATLKAFPNFELTIKEVVQHDNKLIYSWCANAKHEGTILNVQPSGQRLAFSGVVFGEIQNGLITRYHSFSDIPRVMESRLPLTGCCRSHNAANSACFEITYIIHLIQETFGVRLTKREVECLSVWLQGYSIKESARALGGVSHKTIQTFREHIKRKFQVETYQQLFTSLQQSGMMSFFLGDLGLPLSCDLAE